THGAATTAAAKITPRQFITAPSLYKTTSLKMAASLAAGSSSQQRVRSAREGGLGEGTFQRKTFREDLGPSSFLCSVALAAGGLKQEPAALLGLVDELLEQARCGDITV